LNNPLVLSQPPTQIHSTRILKPLPAVNGLMILPTYVDGIFYPEYSGITENQDVAVETLEGEEGCLEHIVGRITGESKHHLTEFRQIKLPSVSQHVTEMQGKQESTSGGTAVKRTI